MFETVLGRLQALAQAEGFDPQPGTFLNSLAASTFSRPLIFITSFISR